MEHKHGELVQIPRTFQEAGTMRGVVESTRRALPPPSRRNRPAAKAAS